MRLRRRRVRQRDVAPRQRLDPEATNVTTRSLADPSLTSPATAYVFPAVSLADTAAVRLVEDNNNDTTNPCPPCTPAAPTVTVVVVRLVDAVADPTRPTYPPGAAALRPSRRNSASLDHAPTFRTAFTAATL